MFDDYLISTMKFEKIEYFCVIQKIWKKWKIQTIEKKSLKKLIFLKDMHNQLRDLLLEKQLK